MVQLVRASMLRRRMNITCSIPPNIEPGQVRLAAHAENTGVCSPTARRRGGALVCEYDDWSSNDTGRYGEASGQIDSDSPPVSPPPSRPTT